MLFYKGACQLNSSVLKTRPRMLVGELTKVSLVAALYVTVTLMLSVISFGVVQLRLSEMFNYLALYHKRYIIAVTAGVVIVNFMSPTWMIDVPVGGLATFLVLILCRSLTRKIRNERLKISITAIIFALSMFTVAGQFTILLGYPFWPTYMTIAIGELLSMTVGGFVIHALGKKINFSL